MKKTIILTIFLSFASFLILNPLTTIFAQQEEVLETKVEEENDIPQLPQTEEEAAEKDSTTQQISSPQFYAETNSESFVKGIAAGFALGAIVGGVLVWFFKKRIL